MTTTREDAQVTRHADPPLPTYRVNLVQVGYLLMVVGLALVKWPLFFSAPGTPWGRA